MFSPATSAYWAERARRFGLMRAFSDRGLSGAIRRDSATLGGTPCFRNTRVPFHTLLDYLQSGKPLESFLADFPGVPRHVATLALEEAGTLALIHARSAR